MEELNNQKTPSTDQIDLTNPQSGQKEVSESLPSDIFPLEIAATVGLQTHAIQEYISSRLGLGLGLGLGTLEDRLDPSMVQLNEESGKANDEESGMDLNLSIGFGSNNVATKKAT